MVNALADDAKLVGAEPLLGRLSARGVVQRERDFAVEDEIDLVEVLVKMRDGLADVDRQREAGEYSAPVRISWISPQKGEVFTTWSAAAW